MTIIFDERKWAMFALFVICTAIGLALSLFSIDAAGPSGGRVWVGGLLCGLGQGAWTAFLFMGSSSTRGGNG